MTDPEVEAMSTVVGVLAGLDDAARSRVVRWAAARYDVTLAAQPKLDHVMDGGGAPTQANGFKSANGDEAIEEDVAPSLFEHFAELYDEAQPTTTAEKLLVAAYWHQKVQGKPSFQALDLNRDLKNLGHQVDHISQALAASVSKKPALILQLRKSGSSQQARKTYKLSGEGTKTVELMVRTRS
jgi:hypothetical protein